jgi:hypothetical protein
MREATRVVVGGKQGCTARREMPVRALAAGGWRGAATRRGVTSCVAAPLPMVPVLSSVRARRPRPPCRARCGCAACLPPQPEVRPSQQSFALLRNAHKHGLIAARLFVLSLVSSSAARGQAHAAAHGAHSRPRDAPSSRRACSWAGQPPERAAAGTPRRAALDQLASSSARDKVVCCVALLSRRRWQPERHRRCRRCATAARVRALCNTIRAPLFS